MKWKPTTAHFPPFSVHVSSPNNYTHRFGKRGEYDCWIGRYGDGYSVTFKILEDREKYLDILDPMFRSIYAVVDATVDGVWFDLCPM